MTYVVGRVTGWVGYTLVRQARTICSGVGDGVSGVLLGVGGCGSVCRWMSYGVNGILLGVVGWVGYAIVWGTLWGEYILEWRCMSELR